MWILFLKVCLYLEKWLAKVGNKNNETGQLEERKYIIFCYINVFFLFGFAHCYPRHRLIILKCFHFALLCYLNMWQTMFNYEIWYTFRLLMCNHNKKVLL